MENPLFLYPRRQWSSITFLPCTDAETSMGTMLRSFDLNGGKQSVQGGSICLLTGRSLPCLPLPLSIHPSVLQTKIRTQVTDTLIHVIKAVQESASVVSNNFFPSPCLACSLPISENRGNTNETQKTEQLALTEASYTTIRLIQEFSRIESRDDGPWEELLTLTMSSRNGTKIMMTPR